LISLLDENYLNCVFTGFSSYVPIKEKIIRTYAVRAGKRNGEILLQMISTYQFQVM
jgi:hypothetical protein